jgi:hypothetical protein
VFHTTGFRTVVRECVEGGSCSPACVDVGVTLLQGAYSLAHLLIWFGVWGLLTRQRYLACLAGGLALLTCLASWWIARDVLPDHTYHFLPGFYLWPTSMALLIAFGLGLAWRQGRRSDQSP